MLIGYMTCIQVLNNGGPFIMGPVPQLSEGLAASVIRRSADLIRAQPELQLLKPMIQQHTQQEHIIASLAQGGVLSGTVSWDPDNFVLQPVRASNNSHGRSYFDNVSLRTDRGHIAYAQLRLLFSLRSATDRRLWTPFAFVRMYRETGATDLLTSHGCVSLTWECAATSPHGHVYKLVALANIIARQYIVPDFAHTNHFSHFQ